MQTARLKIAIRNEYVILDKEATAILNKSGPECINELAVHDVKTSATLQLK